jgi:hypothetical protein
MDNDLRRAVLGGASSVAFAFEPERSFTVVDLTRPASSSDGGDVAERWANFGDPGADLVLPVLGNATYIFGGRGFFLAIDSFWGLSVGGTLGTGVVGGRVVGGGLLGGRLGRSDLGAAGTCSEAVWSAVVGGIVAACADNEPDEDRA